MAVTFHPEGVIISSLSGLCTLTLSSAPHRHQQKFFAALVWEGGGQQIWKLLSTFQVFSRKKNKNNWPPRGQGGPPILFYPKSYLFCDWKPLCKISKAYDNSLWVKSNGHGKKERKNGVNSGHLVLWQRTQAAGTKIFSHLLPFNRTSLILLLRDFFIAGW